MPIQLTADLQRDSTVRTSVVVRALLDRDVSITYTFCNAGHVDRARAFAAKLARTFVDGDEVILALSDALYVGDAGTTLRARGELAFCADVIRLASKVHLERDIDIDEAGSGEMRLEHPPHCLCRSSTCNATITL